MLLNLEDRTPPVYCEESRDFQLFLRLMDGIYNSVKNDVDGIINITDSSLIKTELLPLLQTKLGFFSNYSIDSDVLRTILCAFPTILKNKGSLLGVKQAVITFLKAIKVPSDVDIFYTTSGINYGGVSISDHSIAIGFTNIIDNLYILDELLKYVIPAGFGYTIYFYREYDYATAVETSNSTFRLTVGQDINSSIRFPLSYKSFPTYDSSKTYKVGTLIQRSSKIYRCIEETTGTYNSSKWEEFTDTPTIETYPDLRDVLLNAVDTVLVYDSRQETIDGKYIFGDLVE